MILPTSLALTAAVNRFSSASIWALSLGPALAAGAAASALAGAAVVSAASADEAESDSARAAQRVSFIGGPPIQPGSGRAGPSRSANGYTREGLGRCTDLAAAGTFSPSGPPASAAR